MDFRGKMQVTLTEAYARAITSISLRDGLIPKQCPVCKSSVDRLVFHHWVGAYVYVGVCLGLYRRLCGSCNSLLGSFYRGIYPLDWALQYSKLEEYFRIWRFLYPNFDGSEGWWGRITIEEYEHFSENLGSVLRGGA